MASNIRRLIADVGGTNARFALNAGNRVHDELELACANYPSLASAIDYYLQTVGATQQRPTEAAFAIAAPLTGDHVSMTNHPWQFSVSGLRSELGLRRLIVLNDFTALAMSLRHLPPKSLMQVGGGGGVQGRPVALLGAGTGLGVSGLIPFGDVWLPLEGEGGHVGLSPSNEREAAVLKQLWRSYKHVSAERALSGQGLVNLYSALCVLDGNIAHNYEPADVTNRGMAGTDATCAEALQMFCAIMGTTAGNLVLTLGATGGVYIGGGIVPRLGEYFARSVFRERFEDKGRYASYLAPVPAYVINAERPAFTGLVQAFSSPGPRIEAVA